MKMRKALLMAPMGSVHRRFNQANIEALLSLGYEVHLLANFESGDGPENQNPEYAKIEKSRGIVIHHVPYRRHSLFKNIKNINATRQIVNEESFDIVHMHTETGGLIFRLAGKKRKTKYIYTSHGFSFYKGSPIQNQILFRPVEKWICEMMDLNLAINREDYAVQNLWNAQTSKYVHGIGLDLQKFESAGTVREEKRRELKIPQSAKLILSIGELDDNKNHRIVIEALAKGNFDNAYYLICGVGPNKDFLLSLAEKYNLKDRIILAGYRNDIPEIINASDVFVFPSYHEGLPVSVLEAMAGGLPVVCTNIRGVTDLVEEGVNGFTFNPNDVFELVEKLRIIMDDHQETDSFVLKSREVVTQYSNKAIRDELKKIYTDILH